MRTKCSRIPLSGERNMRSELLKNVFETSTRLVDCGGCERVPVRASADLGPTVAYVFMTPESLKEHRESMTSSPAYSGIPLDRGIEWSDRELKEEVRAKICGMLIDAQEKERAWIARELHDDIAQRIALLAVHLDQWDTEAPPSTPEIHEHIRQVSRGVSDILQGIRALSHHLHSSNLDYLGLEAAARGFCKELSEKRKITIDFCHTGMQRNVPKEISLCLFRVLQEALQNAVKHSGVKHFRVELRNTSDEIQLSVSDSGVGFNPAGSASTSGLGLISMRERMHLIDGEFLVESEPNRGTTVYAWAPAR